MIRAVGWIPPISINTMSKRLPTTDVAPTELIVLSDDWGRHPSSCQHLVRELMAMHGEALSVTWVNTIGTRAMRWSAADFKRAAGKLRGYAKAVACDSLHPLPRRVRAGERIETVQRWKRSVHARGSTPDPHPGLPPERGKERKDRVTGSREPSPPRREGEPRIVSPVMWPGFRNRLQRWFNARSMAGSIRRAVGPRRNGVPRVVLTTLPIAADLPGRLGADRWVYMAVDDFSVWPGLDGAVMDAMERRLVSRVDAAVAVSETLRDRLAGMKREAEVLTHGIDAEHWRSRAAQTPVWLERIHGPVVLFWGLIDARLEVSWCVRLAKESGATLVLVGPKDGEPSAALGQAGVVMPGPAAYAELPAIAARADVLVMPYVDVPVTRAMQPLKLKEYLATGKPVVARDLPATRAWADACDLVAGEDDLLRAVQRRLGEVLPREQLAARQRLDRHTWRGKAFRLRDVLLGESAANPDSAACDPYTRFPHARTAGPCVTRSSPSRAA